MAVLTRLNAIAQLAESLGDGYQGTTTAAGAAGKTTAIDTTDRTENDDFWNGGTFLCINLLNIGTHRRITDFVNSTGTITFAAFANQVLISTNYLIMLPFTYKGYITAFRRALRYAQINNHGLQPWYNEELVLESTTYDYALPYEMSVTGTADSGTTTTLVSGLLKGADDFWIGARLVITAGPNVGEIRTITEYVASTDTLTVDHAYSTAITSASTYELVKFAPMTIHRVEYEYTSGDWREIPSNQWRIVRGGNPKLSFYLRTTPGSNPENMYSNYPSGWSGARLRLRGYRKPYEMENDFAPVEVGLEYLFVYAESLLRHSYGRRRDLDPDDNAARSLAARQEAEVLLNQGKVPLPSDSRWV